MTLELPQHTTNIFPTEIWEHILSFLGPEEEGIPATVCREFYAILANKRTKRGEKIWQNNLIPFCKSVAHTTAIILSKSSNTSELINICHTIRSIAVKYAYYETYKYITLILANHTFELDKMLMYMKYDFVESLLRDGIPLSILVRFAPRYTLAEAVNAIIGSNNVNLIEAMLKFNPDTRTTNVISLAIKTCNLTTLRTVLNICSKEGSVKPRYFADATTNAMDYLTEFMEYSHYENIYSPEDIIHEIEFMCEEYGYVYKTTNQTARAWKTARFTLLETLIKYGCPVSQTLAEVLAIVIPKLYESITRVQNSKPDGITLTSWLDNTMTYSDGSIIGRMHQLYGTKLVDVFPTYIINRLIGERTNLENCQAKLKMYERKCQSAQLKSTTYFSKKYKYLINLSNYKNNLVLASCWKTINLSYLIENKCPVTSEVYEYLRIYEPDLYAKVDPDTILTITVKQLRQQSINYEPESSDEEDLCGSGIFD